MEDGDRREKADRVEWGSVNREKERRGKRWRWRWVEVERCLVCGGGKKYERLLRENGHKQQSERREDTRPGGW